MVHMILHDQSYVACAEAMADTNKCHSGISTALGTKKLISGWGAYSRNSVHRILLSIFAGLNFCNFRRTAKLKTHVKLTTRNLIPCYLISWATLLF